MTLSGRYPLFPEEGRGEKNGIPRLVIDTSEP